MANQRILYAREQMMDGTVTVDTSTVWELGKAPDPEDGSGTALRAEFEEDEWQEYVMESFTVPTTAPPRLSATYGGEVRMFLHPLGNMKPLLENVLWNVFPGGNVLALTPGRTERRLAIKSLVSSDAPQVFKGAMLSELTIELVRPSPQAAPTFQTSAFVTALDYLLSGEADKYFDTADIPEIDNDSTIGHVLHIRCTNLTNRRELRGTVQNPNAFSIYFRPDLREIRGMGKQGPCSFRLGSAPFECGGTFRYLLSGETDEILQYFIKQDVYALEITVAEEKKGSGVQYDFFIPRAMFRQAWVAPPGADSLDDTYYTTIEWIAVQDDGNDLVEIRTPI